MGKRVATILSEDARKYRKAVARHVQAQRAGAIGVTGRLAVEITAYPPDRRARDLDNLPKGVLDSLRHAGVFRDDADIDELHIRRDRVRKGGELQITISEIPGMATTSGQLFEADQVGA